MRAARGAGGRVCDAPLPCGNVVHLASILHQQQQYSLQGTEQPGMTVFQMTASL